MSTVLLLLLAVSVAVQQAVCLVRIDLTQFPWQLSNSNRSISVPTRLPAHVLSVLSSAGIVLQDPSFRFSELETRWVAEDTWNFTLIWPGQLHAHLTGCKHILLVLHGVDTFGQVVLNGRHLLQTNNAHRSWWVQLSDTSVLRDGANMMSVVIQPALAAALRAKALNPYAIPTMKVPGGFDVYNFARKPASDFGWDWGPAFVPAGITGAVELVGFNRATLIGALVGQKLLNSGSSSSTFLLNVTAHFLVPEGGDSGQLSVTLPELKLQHSEGVQLATSVVAGNALQALATIELSVPANRIKLWQPIGRLVTGQQQALHDLQLEFQPAVFRAVPTVSTAPPADSSSIRRRIGFRAVELVQQPIRDAAAELLPGMQPSSSSSGSGNVEPAKSDQGVTQLTGERDGITPSSGVASNSPANDTAVNDTAATDHTTPPELLQQQQQQEQQQRQDLEGESFYFKVNGVPLYAKGANLIPLHVLSTAVTDDDIVGLLQAAAAANMNMIRIWGGGLYQRDVLYSTADELGLLIWQEAMFACSPYPRSPLFLSNVESEVVQQLLRLGSHPSIALWGGNNEIEASLQWYNETKENVALFAVDYQALFVDTIGATVQRMLPDVSWVDSSPSNGLINVGELVPDQLSTDPASQKLDQPAGNLGQEDQAAAGAAVTTIKRWGNPQNPKYGDVHFYNYKDDCQDWRTYPAAHFVSEYGWQSYPSWSTYQAATRAEDWTVDSVMTEYRQRHPNGTAELLAQLQRRFKLPEAWLKLLPSPTETEPAMTWRHRSFKLANLDFMWDTLSTISRWWRAVSMVWLKMTGPLLQQEQQQWWWWIAGSGGSSNDLGSRSGSSDRSGYDMQHYIYLTQLQQMLCYDTALSYWRRLRSNSSVLTMGVLYWQLNDIWPGASWSSIDSAGAWKPLQYGVARSFADVALSVQHDLRNDTIQVHVVSDLAHTAHLYLVIRVLSLADTSHSCSSSSNKEDSSYSRMLQQQKQERHLNPNHQQQQQSSICESVPWSKYCHVTAVTVPPASAVQVWSSTVQLLLSAAAGCTRQDSYVHVALMAAAATTAAAAASEKGVSNSVSNPAVNVLGGSPAPKWSAQQLLSEQTVWLAPFKQINLPDPKLQLSGFEYVPSIRPNGHRGSTPSTTESGTPGSTTAGAESSTGGATHHRSPEAPDRASTSTAGAAADQATPAAAVPGPAAAAAAATDVTDSAPDASSASSYMTDSSGAVQFTVSSSGVAVYAVWELAGSHANALMPGHFSDDAVTVHPCEPRTVRFLPRLGAGSMGDDLQKLRNGQQEGWQQLRQQAEGQGDGAVLLQGRERNSTMQSSTGSTSSRTGSTDAGYGDSEGSQLLVDVLQRTVVLSSLYDHQQFAPAGPSAS